MVSSRDGVVLDEQQIGHLTRICRTTSTPQLLLLEICVSLPRRNPLRYIFLDASGLKLRSKHGFSRHLKYGSEVVSIDFFADYKHSIRKTFSQPQNRILFLCINIYVSIVPLLCFMTISRFHIT